MKKLKVVLRWTGKTLLVLLAILALFILEENLRGHIILSRYKSELRAKGEKLTLAEFNFPKPPPEGEALQTVLRSTGELTNLSKAFASDALWGRRLRFIGPGCCMVQELRADTDIRLRGPSVEVAQPRGRQYQAPSYYVCTWDELADKVALARQPLRAIHATLEKPVLAMSVDYRDAQVGTAQYRAAAAIRMWASVAALNDLRQNNLDAALEDLLIVPDLIRSLQDSQLYELQLERMFTGEVALDRTWEALQTSGWNDAQLAKLQTAWQKASVINEFERGVEVERAITLERWDGVVHKPMRELLGWSERGISSWDDVFRFPASLIWYAAWRQQDQARGVWLWAEGVDAVRAALGASKWTVGRDVFKKAEQDECNLHWLFYDRWRYQMSIPDMPSGTTWGPENLFYEVERLLEYETRREMTVAAIALKRFELRYNMPPPDLAALVPEFLVRVPHDYMDGGNLRYRPKGIGNWILYSVGEDCVDDGGDVTSSEPHTVFFSIWNSRDAVWPAAATQEEVEAYESKIYGRKRQNSESER